MTNWVWKELGTISMLESHTEAGVTILDVRDMTDVEPDIDKIKKIIIIGANLLALGHRVAVRCIGGMNRSNAIVIGIMCYMVWWKGKSLEETWEWHYKRLKKTVPKAQLVPQLVQNVKQALQELVDWNAVRTV